MSSHPARLAAVLALSLTAAACTGSSVRAVDDSVSTGMDEPVVIDVLANDVFPEDGVTLRIVDLAVAGEATVQADQTILYVPVSGYMGADDLKYEIESSNGDTSSARVGIDVDCPTCLAGRNIRLSWTANAPEEMVIGYRMYSGPEEAEDSMEMKDDLTSATPGFDMDMPRLVYDAWADLGMEIGDRACFRVTAYNQVGESDFSNPACIEIDERNANQREFSVGL